MSLAQLHTASVCRLAAVLLALSLSGASRAAASLAPEPEHRCQCASHGEKHRCACKICNERARRARRGEIDKAPPCHRAIVERQVAEEEEREQQEGTDPCLLPDCGGRDPAAPPRASVDAFTLPQPAGLHRPGRFEPLARLAPSGPEAPASPDVPPPRVR